MYDDMDETVRISSELLEEKLKFIHRSERLLDGLYYRLVQIQRENIMVSEKELYDSVNSVKKMLETTEKIGSDLQRFLAEMEGLMAYNRNELDELQEVIAELFI